MNKIPINQFQKKGQDNIPFEILRIEENPYLRRATRPRRDSFFVVFKIDSGSGLYYIDFNRFEIKPNSLFFIAPGQVHYWKIEEPLHGDAILFEDDIFQLHGRNSFLQELDLFDMFGCAATLNLRDEKSDSFDRIIQRMHREYNNRHFKSTDMLVSLLKIFLIEAQRKIPPEDPTSTHNAGQQLTREFLELARQQIVKHHSPVRYAEQLGVTPGHLSETIKLYLGITAGEYLRQRRVLEIKRWLAHSDLTISQIAEKLLFQDTSYLGRFFKRETDQSPGTFRKDFRKKYQNPQL